MTTVMNDIPLRINYINATHEIEEAIFRDMLNAWYLQDVYASQMEIFTGALEEAIKAADVPQDLKNNVTNARKALRKPNLIEKSMESEALYFRHLLLLAYVQGLGEGFYDRAHTYQHANVVADYVLSMYYDIKKTAIASQPTMVTSITFLDPSATIINPNRVKRVLLTNKAAIATRAWAGGENIESNFKEPVLLSDVSYWFLYELTEAGKASLRAAIQAADPTRLSVKPAVVSPLPNMLLDVGASREFDISATFYDDGDTLTYVVVSDDDTIATAALSGDTLTVTGVAEGSTSVSLTATDTDSQAVTDEFTVTVGERDGV